MDIFSGRETEHSVAVPKTFVKRPVVADSQNGLFDQITYGSNRCVGISSLNV